MLGSMMAASAFLEFHERVAGAPARRVGGSAENCTSGGWSTVTVTLEAELPPGPLTVIV